MSSIGLHNRNGHSHAEKRQSYPELPTFDAPKSSDAPGHHLLELESLGIESSTKSSQTELYTDEASIQSTIEAMVAATKGIQNNGDSKFRIQTCITQCYNESLSNKATIQAFRRYEEIKPFPASISDEQLISELRQVESQGLERRPSKKSLTDTSNAERLARMHHDSIRYVTQWKKWIAWDGRAWVIDESGEVYRRAIATIRDMKIEATLSNDSAACNAILEHAIRSESRNRLEAMIGVAKKIKPLPISVHEMNRDPWLLNFQNGTLDLHLGQLREHRREDFINKCLPYEYSLSDSAPNLFLKFLNDILQRTLS